MPRKENIFAKMLRIVNIGLTSFADDLKNQGAEVVDVDWRPPAGGDAEMLKLLEKLGSG